MSKASLAMEEEASCYAVRHGSTVLELQGPQREHLMCCVSCSFFGRTATAGCAIAGARQGGSSKF